MHPLIPFTIRGDLNSSLILFQWDWELVPCEEIKRTLRQAVIHFM